MIILLLAKECVAKIISLRMIRIRNGATVAAAKVKTAIAMYLLVPGGIPVLALVFFKRKTNDPERERERERRKAQGRGKKVSEFI